MTNCLSIILRTGLRNLYAMLRYVPDRTRTDLNRSLLEMIQATVNNGGGLD